MKKSKEVEVNLYNFNADDDDEKKKNKKQKNKKAAKIKKPSKKKEKDEKKEVHDTKFDFNDEIVIGLPKLEEETKKVKKQKKTQKNKTKKIENNTEKQKKSNIKNTDSSKKKSKRKVNSKKTQKVISKKEQEIKKRKRMKKFRILKYAFLVLCVIGIIIGTMTSPLFNIKQIEVQGNEKISKEEIISLSQIVTDENTYKVNVNKVKEQILENPYIKSVQIKRKLPDEVIITVEERSTTYMIEYGNAYAYINNQGYILEISSEKLDVPIIQGAETELDNLIPGQRLCNNDLEKMSTIIKIMEVAQNNDIANLITRIDIENDQNYKILFESEQKVAYLGDETDLSTKILSIKAILDKERGTAGEIFVNMDLKNNYPTFRQSV